MEGVWNMELQISEFNSVKLNLVGFVKVSEFLFVFTRMKVNMYGKIWVCKYFNVQIFEYANMQVLKYASMQVYKYVSMQVD